MITDDFTAPSLCFSSAHLSTDGAADLAGLAPSHTDMRPDSHDFVTVWGDVTRLAELNHPQGQNLLDFQGTCGLAACGEVLSAFGIPTDENTVVVHAFQNGECDRDKGELSGGSNPEQEARLLTDGGLPAHAVASLDIVQLAELVREGHGVIAGVNAGMLWHDPSAYEHGQANHAVFVTGVATDPISGLVEGFYINDSRCLPGDSGRFISADEMTAAWQNTGGMGVVTDAVHV
jgi:hypothetical protein